MTTAVLSLPEVKAALGVSHATLLRWVNAGKLKATKRFGTRWGVAEEDLHKFMVDNGLTPVARPEARPKPEASPPSPGPEAPFGMKIEDEASFYRLVLPCAMCGRRQRASFFFVAWKKPASVLDHVEHMVTKSGGPRRLFNERAPLWEKIERITDPTARGAAVEAVVWFFARMQERSVDLANACQEAIEKAESLR